MAKKKYLEEGDFKEPVQPMEAIVKEHLTENRLELLLANRHGLAVELLPKYAPEEFPIGSKIIVDGARVFRDLEPILIGNIQNNFF